MSLVVEGPALPRQTGELLRQGVERQDEGAVMALINQQDAFCEEARHRRASTAPSSGDPQCSFCEGAIQSDGCLSRLDAVNRAVLHGRWDEAAALVDEYIAWVRRLAV